MNLIAVESSTIRAVGYNPEHQELLLEFVNGGVYKYIDVPASVHTALMAADSKGSFFARQIKNDYQAVRISDPTLADETPQAAAWRPPPVVLHITTITYRRLVNSGSYENFAIEMTAQIAPDEAALPACAALRAQVHASVREELERRGLGNWAAPDLFGPTGDPV